MLLVIFSDFPPESRHSPHKFISVNSIHPGRSELGFLYGLCTPNKARSFHRPSICRASLRLWLLQSIRGHYEGLQLDVARQLLSSGISWHPKQCLWNGKGGVDLPRFRDVLPL